MCLLLCYSCITCIPCSFLVINVCNQGRTLCSPCLFIHITNDYYFPTNGFHIYLSSRSISINSNMSIHLSSSGMWRANMDTGSSQSILQPRMSESFRAWTCKDWLGTRAHWWGFKHCTLSLGGNCSKRRKQMIQYWKIHFNEHIVWKCWATGRCVYFIALSQTWLQDIYFFVHFGSSIGSVSKIFYVLCQNIQNQSHQINLYMKALFYAHFFYAFVL